MSLDTEKIEILLGDWPCKLPARTFEPFNSLVIAFLSELSVEILKDSEIREFPDLASFAFFIRESNLLRLSEKHDIREIRKGRGMVFHIAPSNVPLNFAYSLVFSLLAGNSNVIRLPSKDYYQVSLITSTIKTLVTKPQYLLISELVYFIRYGHDKEVTQAISDFSDARVVWGGDGTIRKIRESILPLSAIDIGFRNKYSATIISAEKFLVTNSLRIDDLARKFFTDAYLFDQHGCSSPKLVIWFGGESDIREAKEIFWKKVQCIAEAEYDLQQIHSVDKFVEMCQLALQDPEIVLIKNTNYLFRVSVTPNNKLIGRFQGSNGIFLETSLPRLEEVPDLLSENFQTLTYFGFEKQELESIVINLKNAGLDRIVPVGQAFNMETIWDGMDLVRTLSRVIDLK